MLAGAQSSTRTPRLASSSRLSCSAASNSFRGARRPLLAPCGDGRRAARGASASRSAPNARASATSSAAPGGASPAFETSANGTSARGASAGLATQSCRAHFQTRKRISAGSRSWAKAKSEGQEKPRSQRVWPPTRRGIRAARRQRPLSATDSSARDSMGAPCLPGSFGSRLKNCERWAAMAMAPSLSSSSSSSSDSSAFSSFTSLLSSFFFSSLAVWLLGSLPFVCSTHLATSLSLNHRLK
mmetsp:Transcript_16858/g.52930  ORF Transcript_16858/g.52930 Transcript_16858/m.52930 type:complete len:242 (-) Transcript_16858:1050-1775(-)